MSMMGSVSKSMSTHRVICTICFCVIAVNADLPLLHDWNEVSNTFDAKRTNLEIPDDAPSLKSDFQDALPWLPRNFFSQDKSFQDQFIVTLFENKTNGYFVDLATNDWMLLSNTLHIEHFLNWKGVCIEPNPQYHVGILANRKCKLFVNPVSDIAGQKITFDFFAEWGGIVGNDYDNKVITKGTKSAELVTTTLEKILDYVNAPKIIDYFSLDVEGAEEHVLSKFPFDKYTFLAMTIERPNENLHTILMDNGYYFVKILGNFGDTLYIHQSWPNFDELMQTHCALCYTSSEPDYIGAQNWKTNSFAYLWTYKPYEKALVGPDSPELRSSDNPYPPIFEWQANVKKFREVFIKLPMKSRVFSSDFRKPWMYYESRQRLDGSLIDQHILLCFNDKQNGYYVDVGTGDWEVLSSTFIFDHFNQWQGICVEPNPVFHRYILANRHCSLYKNPVYSQSGEIIPLAFTPNASEHVDVASSFNLYDKQKQSPTGLVTVTLEQILKHGNAPTVIDLLHVNVAYGDEHVFGNFPFGKYTFLTVLFEKPNRRIHSLLLRHGYSFHGVYGYSGKCLYFHQKMPELDTVLAKLKEINPGPTTIEWGGEKHEYLLQSGDKSDDSQ